MGLPDDGGVSGGRKVLLHNLQLHPVHVGNSRLRGRRNPNLGPAGAKKHNIVLLAVTMMAPM